MNERVYKYKLDFYYKSLALYLLTLLVYILIKGKFFQEKFEVVFKDPIIYIISIFIVYFAAILIANKLAARVILFNNRQITLKSRFGSRSIGYDEIRGVKFTRRRRRADDDSSHSRTVKLRLANRRRILRIRLSDFENEKQLESEFRKISK